MSEDADHDDRIAAVISEGDQLVAMVRDAFVPMLVGYEKAFLDGGASPRLSADAALFLFERAWHVKKVSDDE